jgi:hypothetical protein
VHRDFLITLYNSLPNNTLNLNMIGNNSKMSYTGIFQINRSTLSKNFWSSAEIINLINYFCCNLYCIIFLLCYAQYLILETVVLTFVYCTVLCSFFLCVTCFFLTSFMSNYCMTEFVDRWNDMCVCMYVCKGPGWIDWGIAWFSWISSGSCHVINGTCNMITSF